MQLLKAFKLEYFSQNTVCVRRILKGKKNNLFK
jgi:hypothetical protein